MSTDPRPQRHDAKRAAIVDAAWQLAGEVGLSAVSLRALAARVGLRQPSLYAYFASKNDLYDAMFARGNEQLLAWMDRLVLPADPTQAVKVFSRKLMAFFTEDPMRYELMFERTLPGFEPSRASYELAQQFFDRMRREVLDPAGIATQAQVDVYVALMAGLAGAQRSNNPRGRRWTRHLDWVIDMYLREIARQWSQDNGP